VTRTSRIEPRMAFGVDVPMRDGTRLSADVFLPPAGDGPWPALLNRTPYDKSRHPEIAAFLAAHGYAVVVQDVRGRGDSDGRFDPWLQEADDGYDSVEWAASRHWCTGDVGIYGGSYQSYCGWAAARGRPPHLKALVSRATSGISQLGVYHDLGCAPPYWLWFFNLTSGRVLQSALDRESPALDWARVLATRPLRKMDAAIGRQLPVWHRFIEAMPGDDYSRALDLADVFEGLDLPVLHITGWNDAAKWGELRTWREMSTRSAAADRQWLLIGPWDHYGTGAPQQVTQGRDFGEHSTIDVKAAIVRFFDAMLTGNKNGWRNEPRVRAFIMGQNEWTDLDNWPPPSPSPKPATWYLHSAGRANSIAGDGFIDLRPPDEDEPPDGYLYSPDSPTPSTPDLNTAFTSGRQLDNRWKLHRDDILVYTSAPLTTGIKIAGNPIVTLFASSDRLDTDFHFQLCEVQSDGRSYVISHGFVRASFRGGPTSPRKDLTPGEITELTVKLGATANYFAPNTRIRLVIASADFPDVDRNPNTGAPVGDDTISVVAQNSIYHSVKYQTSITLPILI
jgi:uncharacterized protein